MREDKTKVKSKKQIKKEKKREEKISYHRRPENLELDAWQFALRKKFGEENPFTITNMGTHRLISTFQVYNPDTQNDYRVTIRHGMMRFGKLSKPNLYWANNACTCHDFRTNRLGICKHISSVLQQLSAIRGNKKLLKTPPRAAESLIYLDYKNGRNIRLFIGNEQTEIFTEWAKNYFDTEGVILPNAWADFDHIIQTGKEIHPSFGCTPDAFDFVLQKKGQERRQSFLKKRLSAGANDAYFDDLLKVRMFPYQCTGAYYAALAGRCLIADEMGLGKTIQAIAATEVYRRELGIKKVLVICPTSLKYQWKTEIEKFSPEATINVVEGTALQRRKQYQTSEALYDIMSYHVVANDAELINEMNADLVILDEAQRIKNFRTRVATQLKKVQTPYCFVLTGTPLENKLDELYSIMQFIDQFKLPPLYRFLDRYQISDANGRVVGFRNLKEIGQVLSDCLIRRLKRDVLKELPKRMDKTLFVPMTKEQMDMHNELADVVAQLVAKWQRFHFLNEQDRQKLILCLSQMRMVCDSTYILDQNSRFDTKITELMCILEEALTNESQKVVVFSQWERMTRLVAQEMDERGIGYANLHGGIPSRNRANLLDRFRDDADCRVFLSTDAGGVGLNLQSASLLINLDIPWNPAILEQRIGRIYRLGQEQNVTIINMVAMQTIEHRMLGILEFKSEMAKGVLDPEGDDTIFMSESKLRRFMESVESLATTSGSALVSNEQFALPTLAEETEDMETPMPTESVEKSPISTQRIPRPKGLLVSGEGEQKTKEEQQKPAEKEPFKTFDGDDDVKPQATKPTSPKPQAPATTPSVQAEKAVDESSKMPSAVSSAQAPPTSPQELIQTGLSFFSSLAQTLNSAEKTQELVSSIVKKDETTGQTYLHIPIDNQEVVSNALKVLGSFFGSLGK